MILSGDTKGRSDDADDDDTIDTVTDTDSDTLGLVATMSMIDYIVFSSPPQKKKCSRAQQDGGATIHQ